ncbi:MAG: polysaccharide deacetylase family protein [Candidatus Buchananbacteria bacterium]
MTDKIKIFLKDLLAGLLVFLPARPNRAVILMYHSLGDNGKFFTVKPADFSLQLDYLKRHKYNVVSLAVLSGYLTAGKIPPRTVVITFDDGYADNYSIAFPELKKHGFPATIFLATGLPFSGLSLLTNDQISEMIASALIDFEPHTVSHAKLTKIDLAEARREIVESRISVERLCQKSASYFAYPYGCYNQQIIELLKTNGFELALTVAKGVVSPKSNRWLLKRNAIDSAVSPVQFKAIVKFGKR